MTNFLRTPILKNICEQLLPLIINEGKKIFLKKSCFTFIARIFVAATRRRRDIKIQFYLSAHVPLWTCNFLPEVPFLSKLGPKIKILNLSLNLVHRLIRICKIQWWCLPFLFYTRNTLFGQIWSQNSKLSV